MRLIESKKEMRPELVWVELFSDDVLAAYNWSGKSKSSINTSQVFSVFKGMNYFVLQIKYMNIQSCIKDCQKKLKAVVGRDDFTTGNP